MKRKIQNTTFDMIRICVNRYYFLLLLLRIWNKKLDRLPRKFHVILLSQESETQNRKWIHFWYVFYVIVILLWLCYPKMRFLEREGQGINVSYSNDQKIRSIFPFLALWNLQEKPLENLVASLPYQRITLELIRISSFSCCLSIIVKLWPSHQLRKSVTWEFLAVQW